QDFLFQLAVELAAKYRESREKEDKPKTLINISSDSRVRKTCQVRYCKDNKATKICLKCKKYVCGICTSENFIVCRKCNENE
uniref:Tnp_zf-ribbon_2 domain-containing protein n=1 Tax=Strongyloides papillosus TaxID=174720 RepID=A0A0N5B2V0_STREA